MQGVKGTNTPCSQKSLENFTVGLLYLHLCICRVNQPWRCSIAVCIYWKTPNIRRPVLFKPVLSKVNWTTNWMAQNNRIYCLTVWQARSLKSRRPCFLWPLRKDFSLPLPASGGPRHSLPCGNITTPLPSSSCGDPPSVCVLFLFLFLFLSFCHF